MAIKVTENVRHNGISYFVDDVINDINKKDAKRLVKLGVAFYVKEIPIEESEDIDFKSQMEEKFNASELKEVAQELGIDFQSNISKAKLIELIIELKKVEEVLEFEFIEEDE